MGERSSNQMHWNCQVLAEAVCGTSSFHSKPSTTCIWRKAIRSN